MAILFLIIIFGTIIIIHEYGHFIAARKSGVFVEEFAIGMGPKLWGKEKDGTLYSIRAIPLGGYCKMKDEDSASNDPDSFSNATKFKKFIILFAGAFMNFILAIVIFIVISIFSSNTTLQIKSVSDGLPAQLAGVKEGDIIYKINGKRINIFNDVQFFISKNSNTPFDLTIKRNNEKINFNITPTLKENNYLIGISPTIKTPLIGESIEGFSKTTILDSIYYGFWNMIFTIKVTIIGLVDLVTSKVNFNQVMGPIGLAPVINETYVEASKFGFKTIILTMLNLTALLSANIGVMNLLPLPALDGGRILFLLIEVIRKKPIPEEKEGFIHLVGFFILMGLGVVIAFKDLISIF